METNTSKLAYTAVGDGMRRPMITVKHNVAEPNRTKIFFNDTELTHVTEVNTTIEVNRPSQVIIVFENIDIRWVRFATEPEQQERGVE